MASAISVHNLSVTVREKRHPKTLLSNVGFAVERRKFIAVIGASGCGKSTLIKSMAGLNEPAAGQILFAGQSVRDLNEHLPLAVGFLPQFGAFHEKLTVEENLSTASALRLPRKVTGERRQAWMNHTTELARIDPLLPQEYLQTFRDTRYFDIVRQSSETWVAPYPLGMAVLGLHILVALVSTVFLTSAVKWRASE